MSGLKPLPEDTRDFKLGAIYDLPELSELPDSFVIGLPEVINQRKSDFCTMAASAAASELQEGVPLGFEWMFAVGKMLDGDVDGFGLDLRTACKAHTKFGAIERKDSPFSINSKSPDFLRRIENWPENLFELALKHRKQSFVKVTGPYDHFDNIRATIWLFRAEKRAVITGLFWSWGHSEIKINQAKGEGEPHAVAVLGWEGDYLVVQNSYGENSGQNGRHYISREVINQQVPTFGSFTFIDLDPYDVKNYYLDNGIKVGENWIIQLLKTMRLFEILKRMLKNLGYGK